MFHGLGWLSIFQDNICPIFKDQTIVAGLLDSWKMGPVSGPETSVTDCQPTPHKSHKSEELLDDLILFESRNFLLNINSVGTKHELVTDLLHCFYFAFVIFASKAEHFHGSTVSLTDVLCLVWLCPVFMIDCRLRNGCNLLYCQSSQTVLYILSHCPWL